MRCIYTLLKPHRLNEREHILHIPKFFCTLLLPPFLFLWISFSSFSHLQSTPNVSGPWFSFPSIPDLTACAATFFLRSDPLTLTRSQCQHCISTRLTLDSERTATSIPSPLPFLPSTTSFSYQSTVSSTYATIFTKNLRLCVYLQILDDFRRMSDFDEKSHITKRRTISLKKTFFEFRIRGCR